MDSELLKLEREVLMLAELLDHWRSQESGSRKGWDVRRAKKIALINRNTSSDRLGGEGEGEVCEKHGYVHFKWPERRIRKEMKYVDRRSRRILVRKLGDPEATCVLERLGSGRLKPFYLESEVDEKIFDKEAAKQIQANPEMLELDELWAINVDSADEGDDDSDEADESESDD